MKCEVKFNLSKNIIQEIWKLVKSIKSNNSNDLEDEISPVVWHDYFKNLNEKKVTSENSRNETQFVRDYRLCAVKSDNILDAPISVHEVCASAKKLRNKMSSAGYVISNEIIN
jgi:23S rRNA G2445 N2-methylase RlmL